MAIQDDFTIDYVDQKIVYSTAFVDDRPTGIMTLYGDDGVTPIMTAQLYEDVAGTQTYRGQGAERRERLE